MTEETAMSAGLPLPDVLVEVMVKHCALMLKSRLNGIFKPRGLAVGCGAGDEAAYVRRALAGSRLIGLDTDNRFSTLARREADLLMGDARSLPFPPACFDFAFALHSLEHVGGAREALAEIARVLKPGAWFYMGVPNRTRLLGYLGSTKPTRLQKITWNLKDYADRLRGRFTNELGAHAGFSWTELERLLGAEFRQVECQTEALLRFKYSERLPRRLLDAILGPRLIGYTAPSHYALCRKAP